MAERDIGVQGYRVGNVLPTPPEPQLRLSPVSWLWQHGSRHVESDFTVSLDAGHSATQNSDFIPISQIKVWEGTRADPSNKG